MKTILPCLSAFRMLVILAFLYAPARGATIWSTPSGGNWNATSTWEGGQIPQNADDVVIRGGAVVNAILGTYTSCNSLSVQANGILLYNGSGTVTLSISNFVANSGKIKNGTGNLVLAVSGNILHDGSEWSNNKVSLAGGATQQVSFTSEVSFTGSNFSVDGTIRTIQALTSLSFSGTSIDFNLSALELASGCQLSVSGGILADLNLTGPAPVLEMSSGAILNNSTLNGTLLKGTIAAGTGTNHFSGTTTVSAGAFLENSGTSHTIFIDGSIINNGTIRNGSNNLTLLITGDVINNGTWENYETNLSGSSDQQISCGTGCYFSCTLFYNQNCLTKNIIALSDIEFRGANINFAYGSPGSVRGNVILPDGKCLKASGAGSNHILSRLNLMSAGTEAKLWLATGQYLSGFSNSSLALTLMGTIMTGSSEIYLSNDVRVLDTLVNYGTSHTVYVDGNLTNMGYIFNGSSLLDIRVTGNIVYNGIVWSNNKVTLTGAAAQTVSFAPFSDFSGAYFECNAAHDVNLISNASFRGTKINLMNSTLVMAPGATFNVGGTDARLTNCTINGDFTFNCEPDAYVSSVTFNGQVSLQGINQIYNNVIFFNGAAENGGILQNQNLSMHTVYFQSHFTNDGTVQNGPGLGNLVMEIKGNVTNNGTWNNYSCILNGTGDQHVRLAGDQPISSPVSLVIPPGGNNYQWFKDGQPIPGALSATLVLPSVSVAQYGIYYCTSSMGASRHFTIQRFLTADFTADPLNGCTPQQTNFTDNSASPYPIQDWLWEFGDGETATDQNPVHSYQDTGAYSVSLTVTDGYVTRKTTKSDFIRTYLTPVPDFGNTTVCQGTPTSFTDLTTDILYTTPRTLRYASYVISFSSQYSSTNWSAQHALGPPDVYPDHNDSVNAWASLTENSQREYLELGFDDAAQVSGVIIYETLYPGSIDTVYLRDPGTGQWVTVWSGTATPQPLTARAFEISFPLTAFNVSQVRIAMNSPAVPYWNEIDAVALVIPLPGETSGQTTYLWDVDENGVTFATKGNISYTYLDPGDHTVTLTVVNNGLCQASAVKTVHVYPATAGGTVTGGSTIHWGESTGILTLEGFTGDILKWQKRVIWGEGLWTDISHTGPEYSEYPESMGLWDYRAQVRSGSCDPVFSSPATVVVLKPFSVTWNGNVSNAWADPANWTLPLVPDGEVDVIIPDVTPNPFPVVIIPAACGNILIAPASSLTISPGATLEVNGDCILAE